MAPNIQLAGNFDQPQQQRRPRARPRPAPAARAARRRSATPARRRGRRDPGQRQHHRQRRGEDDDAHGLHHRDRRQVGAALDRQNGDLRQRAGAAGQKRRGAVPAMDALQIEAGAEGRAEGRERQAARWSADRRRHAGSVAATPASPAKSRAAPARSGSGAAARTAAVRRSPRRRPRSWRRKSARPADCANRNSTPPGGADRERFEHIQDFGCGWGWQRPSMRGSGSRRLMANPRAGDKCASAMQQCALVASAARPARVRGRAASRRLI